MRLHTLNAAEPIELVEVAELPAAQVAADAAALFAFLVSHVPAGTVNTLAALILTADAVREESQELAAAAEFYGAKIL